MLDLALEALKTTGTLIWYTLWAFIFGYLISAAIQVLVTREGMARVLGDRGPRQTVLAGFFGFISSSCSFADLAATRAVFQKGAHPVNALSFLIASTNLVIETGIVLWMLVGWKFVVANYALGIIMIIYLYILTSLWLPQRLAKRAYEHANRLPAEELRHPSPEGLRWHQKLRSRAGWHVISMKFFGEWKMAYKEVLIGFTAAGIIAAFVPETFWNMLFAPEAAADPSFLTVLQHALIAPVMAFFTFVGSLGSIPLAAFLWTKDASFGGVMSFLGADLVAATVIYLNVKYYGWAFAAYISGLLYICTVAAGITVHWIFAGLDAIPTVRPDSLQAMMDIGIDTHTFWLNVIFIPVAVALFVARWRIVREQNQ